MSEVAAENCDPETRLRINEILRRFHATNDMETNDYLDSDDDEELPDLSERLRNVDLNDAEKVWSLLGAAERQEFESLLHSGDAAKLVPIWMPWWENKIYRKPVEEMDKNCYNYREICPALLTHVKPFQDICVSYFTFFPR